MSVNDKPLQINQIAKSIVNLILALQKQTLGYLHKSQSPLVLFMMIKAVITKLIA